MGSVTVTRVPGSVCRLGLGLGQQHCALLLPGKELLDVLAAELGTFDDGVADAREHLLEPGADLALADLLGAPLDPFGRLVHLGLVGGGGRPAGQSQGREESGSDPHPAKSSCHDAPPCVTHGPQTHATTSLVPRRGVPQCAAGPFAEGSLGFPPWTPLTSLRGSRARSSAGGSWRWSRSASSPRRSSLERNRREQFGGSGIFRTHQAPP